MTDAVRRVDQTEFDRGGQAGVAAAVHGVIDAATSADGVAPLDESALLTLRHRGIAGSTLLVSDDPAAGFAWVHEGDLSVVVGPSARGDGRGRDLVEMALESTDVTTAWAHGDHPAAARLGAAFGFDRSRELWVMRRSLAHLPEGPEPEDYRVRTFVPGRDEEGFIALNAEAFAQHPEQGGLTRADLDERIAEAWFDPGGFFVAESPAGRLLGFHWTKVHDGDPPVGEVYVVGVSPEAQGGGLGRALTLTGLHHLASRGLDEVLLYVESDNAPAVAVYSRLGFDRAAKDTHVQYRRIDTGQAPSAGLT
ncbi:MAG: mycothiol synthase [Nocardioides sp.]